jgi:hypothetical protein
MSESMASGVPVAGTQLILSFQLMSMIGPSTQIIGQSILYQLDVSYLIISLSQWLRCQRPSHQMVLGVYQELAAGAQVQTIAICHRDFQVSITFTKSLRC